MNRGRVADHLIIVGDTGLFAISGHLWRTNPLSHLLNAHPSPSARTRAAVVRGASPRGDPPRRRCLGPQSDEPGRRVPLIWSLPAFAHHFIYDVAECPAMIVEVRGEHVP